MPGRNGDGEMDKHRGRREKHELLRGVVGSPSERGLWGGWSLWGMSELDRVCRALSHFVTVTMQRDRAQRRPSCYQSPSDLARHVPLLALVSPLEQVAAGQLARLCVFHFCDPIVESFSMIPES